MQFALNFLLIFIWLVMTLNRHPILPKTAGVTNSYNITACNKLWLIFLYLVLFFERLPPVGGKIFIFHLYLTS